jgi:phytoene synthase
MEQADYHPFKTPVEIPQWRRQWRLWRAARQRSRR